MKKTISILLLSLMALASSMTFSSCTEEDVTPQQEGVKSGLARDPL